MRKKRTLSELVALEQVRQEVIKLELTAIADIIRQKVAVVMRKTVDQVEVTITHNRVDIFCEIADNFKDKKDNRHGMKVTFNITPERSFFINGYKWAVFHEYTPNSFIYCWNSGWSRNLKKTKESIINEGENWLKRNLISFT